MKAKKALLITGVTGIVGLASLGGVVSAANANHTIGDDTLVDRIATKFNLNKDEVQQVFDEERKVHEAEHQARMEKRLTQAVTDGKITEDQKESILAKHAEMKTYMESLKDKTPEERKTLMKEKMNEMRQWAKDNGLTEYFGKGMVMGFGHGSKGGPISAEAGDKIKVEAGDPGL